MVKRNYVILLIILICPLILNSFFSEDSENIYISSNYIELTIPKSSGMIKSAFVRNSDFELATDKSNYSLFFPEFIVEGLDVTNQNYDFYYPPEGSSSIIYEIIDYNEDFIALSMTWNTDYLNTKWIYKFYKDQPYFYVDIVREVTEDCILSNAQQCIMFNSDFDDSWIVDYNGDLHNTMSNNGPYGWNCSSQHSMFTALDYGDTDLLPMLAWHDDENDIIVGVLTTNVSANQRETISYHGGGSNHTHPGYAEGQWNWFGKSDSESMYFKKGTKYSMQLCYYFSFGSIVDLVNFNKNLLNKNFYIEKDLENYFSASFGARTASGSEQYFYRFPQVTNNFISSQELFRHRAFSIPRTQNGTWNRDLHIFDYYVKASVDGDIIDLTPIYGLEPLFSDGGTLLEEDRMTGWMEWDINDITNRLNYTAFETSDKIEVSGEINISNSASIDSLYIELVKSPRVDQILNQNGDLISFNTFDDIFSESGICAYDYSGITKIKQSNDRVRLHLMDVNRTAESFNYSFKLYPFLNHIINDLTDISDFNTINTNTYKDYFITLPGYENHDIFGVSSTRDYTVTKASICDSLIECDIFVTNLSEPLKLFFEDFEYENIYVNDSKIDDWIYNYNGLLEIAEGWVIGINKLLITNDKDIDFPESTYSVYPNPVKSNMQYRIRSEDKSDKAQIKIYNIRGELVKSLDCYPAKQKSITINTYTMPSGLYFLSYKSESYIDNHKIIVIH